MKRPRSCRHGRCFHRRPRRLRSRTQRPKRVTRYAWVLQPRHRLRSLPAPGGTCDHRTYFMISSHAIISRPRRHMLHGCERCHRVAGAAPPVLLAGRGAPLPRAVAGAQKRGAEPEPRIPRGTFCDSPIIARLRARRSVASGTGPSHVEITRSSLRWLEVLQDDNSRAFVVASSARWLLPAADNCASPERSDSKTRQRGLPSFGTTTDQLIAEPLVTPTSR